MVELCLHGREGVEEDSGRVKHMLGKELPALAKEVARVGSFRSYAGRQLCLLCFLYC